MNYLTPGPFPQAFDSDPDELIDPNSEMAIEETTVARPDVESDTRAIAEQIFDRLAERAPGWIARDGNLDVWLIEEFSTVAGEIRGEAITVPEAIYQTYGEEVLGIPISLAQAATGLSKWTAIDERGYLIPAGAQLTIARTGDDLVAFEVAEQRSIDPGTRSVEGVPIRAVIPGAAGNGLVGEGDPVDPLAWVETIEVEVPTSLGVNGQTVEQYLTELIMLMRLVALRPVLPWDFAILALRIPGVARAIAMNGYDPTNDTWGNARMITLIVTDADGNPLPEIVKQAVRDYLEALREVNWVVWVIDAQYETIDVSYEVTAFAEQNPDVVETLATEAIRNALRPSLFRLGTTSPAISAGEVIPPPPPYGQGGPTRSTLRVNDFVGLLDRVRGVDWVNHDGVLIQGNHDDYALSGPTTLPRPGTITGTVNVQ